jgi:hypothetical protein
VTSVIGKKQEIGNIWLYNALIWWNTQVRITMSNRGRWRIPTCHKSCICPGFLLILKVWQVFLSEKINNASNGHHIFVGSRGNGVQIAWLSWDFPTSWWHSNPYLPGVYRGE